jgi:hypothetical protein
MHQPQGKSGMNENQTRVKPCRLDVFVVYCRFILIFSKRIAQTKPERFA